MENKTSQIELESQLKSKEQELNKITQGKYN